MVTASAAPSTRISSGSSTATSSATPSRSISACIPLFRTGVAMAGRYPGPDSLRRPVSTFDRLADLPLEIESYELEGRQLQVSSAFERHTTLIRLQGGDAEGVGEDVTYDAPDQLALQDAGPVAPLAGTYTIGSFCDHVGGLDLFPSEPERDVSRLYRRWAFE